jgi:hypothetical protein
MADNLKRAAARDDHLIDTRREQDITFWTEELGVSRQELLDAVNTVGPSAEAVQEHLGKGSQ